MSSAIVSRSQQVYSVSQEVSNILTLSSFWLDMADPACYTLTNFYTIASLIDKSPSPKSPLTITGTLRYDIISKGVVMNSNSFNLPMAAPGTTPTSVSETIFVVAYQYGASATTYLNPATSGSRQIRADPQGGSYTRVGSAGVVTFNISPNYAQRFVASYVYTNGAVTQYFNGVFNGTNTTNFTAAPTSQAAANFQGTLFEMIIFNTALNDTQIETINKYLIDKWSVPTTGLISSPLSVTGCTLWLDASDTSTITYGAGTNVQQWSDKSGNGYHAIQNTAGQQPFYDSSLGGIKFTSASITYMSTSAPVTRTESVFAVVRLPSTGGDIIGSSASTRGREFRVFAAAAANFVRLIVDNVQQFGSTAGGGLLNTTDRYVISYVNTVANAYFECLFNRHQNGILGSAAPYSATTLASTNLIGVSGSSFNIAPYDGMIHELIIFNSEVSADNRRAITDYLINKWNITVGPNAVRFPFYRTPVFSRLFNPLDIAGCQVWLDATDNSKITRGTTFLTNITNKGSVSTTFSPTIANRIAFNNINGLQTLRFPNSTEAIRLISDSAITNLLTGTAIGIFRCTSTVNDTRAAIFHWDVTNSFAVGFTNLSTFAPFVTGVGAGTVSDTYSVNNNYIFSTSWFSGGTMTLFTNGTSRGVSTIGTLTAASGTAKLRIGGNANTLQFDLGELIIYNTYLSTGVIQLVEGYLANKWRTISDLASTHVYKSLSPTTAIFNPLTMNAFCSLWLDGGDGTSITTSGGFVTQWNDKSGNGWHAVSIGTGPTYNSSTNSVEFTGAQNLRGAATQLHNNSTGNWSAFAVCSFSDLAGVPVLFNYDSTPTRVAQFFRVNSGPNTMETIQFTNTGSPTFANTTAAVTLNTTTMFEAINTAANLTVYSNGANSATTAHGTNITTANNFYTVGVYQELSSTGVIGAYTGNYFSGSVNEILVFRMDLSTVQRQLIEGYLAWKWKIQGNLPSTHPYKTAPPY